mgnify:CR=1 FL=1
MMKKSLCYSAITLAVTFVIGELLLFLFPEGNAIGSSIGLYAMDNPAGGIRRMWLEMVFAAKA